MKRYTLKELLSQEILDKISKCRLWEVRTNSKNSYVEWKSISIGLRNNHEVNFKNRGDVLFYIYIAMPLDEPGKGSEYKIVAPLDGIYSLSTPRDNWGNKKYKDLSLCQFKTINEFGDSFISKYFSYSIENDDFDNEKRIIWKQDDGILTMHGIRRGNVWFDITANKNGVFFKFIWSNDWRKKNDMKGGDTLTLIFDNKEKVQWKANNNPIRISSLDYYQYVFPVNEGILNMLANHHIVTWKMDFSNGDMPFVSGKYSYNEYDAAIFCAYVRNNINIFNQCGYKIVDLEPTEITKVDAKCFVYLMLDEANGFYKIGISNHPEYREHTLQSEKPTITLKKAKEFPSRIIAEAIESALHKAYADKRLRGEWFRLDEEDVEKIILTLT